MSNVLIMGGSYFIGKHVVNVLKRNYQVTVLNRGSRPFDDSSVDEIVADRNDESALIDCLKGKDFDYVVDISGFNGRHENALLNALNLTAIKKFIFISTSAVYNLQKSNPPYQESDPLGGDSPFKDYAKNKIEAEMILNQRLNQNQLVMLRPPFVFGEDNYILRERLFFYLIENNLPIYVPISNNKIQFVYVKDLADYVRKSIEGTIPCGTYNIGYKEPHTFYDFIELCANQVGKEANVVFVNSTEIDERVIDFFPYFDYDNYLSSEKLYKYYHKNTPIEFGLKSAYQDYLKIKDTLKLPDKMIASRNRIEAYLKNDPR